MMKAAEMHPGHEASVVRLGADGAELVQLRWGWPPADNGEPVINVRAETADLAHRRCLVPAHEFVLFTGSEVPKRRWTVRLRGEPLFFFAALWRAATPHWPESYAVITIDAAPDLAPLTDRQMAVIRPRTAGGWLLGTNARDYLEPLAGGSYEISEAASG